MAALRFLGMCALVLLALAAGALALGAYASLNYAAPLWLRTLSLPEGLVSARLGLAVLSPWLRALGLTALSAALMYLAASWPPVVRPTVKGTAASHAAETASAKKPPTR